MTAVVGWLRRLLGAAPPAEPVEETAAEPEPEAGEVLSVPSRELSPQEWAALLYGRGPAVDRFETALRPLRVPPIVYRGVHGRHSLDGPTRAVVVNRSAALRNHRRYAGGRSTSAWPVNGHPAGWSR